DQAMVSKILSLANSPIYGSPQKVSTVEMAIVVLGFDLIKEVIISLSLLNATNSTSDRYFNAVQFNKHSSLSAMISKMLSNDFDYQISGEAFIGGLLHDIGISAINKYYKKEFNLTSELRFYRNISQLEAEKILLGKTHAEIGGEIAQSWNFPKQLVDTIMYHHAPSKSKVNPVLTSIVHLADSIASKISYSFLMMDENTELDFSIIEVLNLPDETYLIDVINSYIDVISLNYKDIFKPAESLK
ncbi:MAG: HDOD domain-containing protein, partial [Ignavibacteria bacterium]|nr:HDOD domain-containing protein [Ignavibacteria bacterium]